MSICKHYKNIAPEKLGNLISKADLKECSNPAHKSTANLPQSSELWFCLVCGYIGCNRDSASACSLKHYEQKNHSLCVNPGTLVIWCYECDSSIDEVIEQCQNKNKAESNRLATFKDKATQVFFKVNKELKKSKNTVVVVPGSETAANEPSDVGKFATQASIPKTVFGLRNVGNTCFFNSVMQCLNATQPLTNVYLDLKHFDVSDLKEEEDTSKAPVSNDDWITVSNPKPVKAKGGKGNTKGKNNKYHQEVYKSSSSFINVCKNFQDFLLEARARKDHNYDPSSLFNSISYLFSRFRGYSQQDAQELLRSFLDGLSTCEEKRFTATELAQSRKGFKHRLTEVEKIFGGYLCNYVKCQDCKYVNRTFDFCLDIVLNIDKEKPKIVEPKKKKKKEPEPKQEETADAEQDKTGETTTNGANNEEEKAAEPQEIIPNEPRYKQVDPSEIREAVIPHFDANLYDLYEPNIDELIRRSGDVEPEEKNYVTIEEALKEFTGVEILNKSKNFYKCENCEKEKKISSGSARRFYVYDPPQVLTLVLKRYRQLGIGRFEKVNTEVRFKETLVLDPFVLLPARKSQADEVETDDKPRFEYDLYGVVVQSGNLNGGHYISYTKHNVNGEEVWFYHSDTTYKSVKKEVALKSQPYILFYTLRKDPSK